MGTSVEDIGKQNFPLKLWLSSGIIAPLLFVVVFLIEGATRPDYSALRHPVSSLSIGDSGWMQATNFIITGILLVIFSFGLRQALQPTPRAGTVWGPLLIGLVGIGLTGAGFFTADPIGGYPSGTPPLSTERSVHGILHDLFGVPVFIGLPIACFVLSRRFAKQGERGWAIYSIITGCAMLVAFVLAAIRFRQVPGWADFGGIFQRLTIIIGFTWIALLAIHMQRNLAQTSRKSG